MFSHSRESLISLSSMRMMKYKRYWLLESYHDKVILDKRSKVASYHRGDE